ncbi:histidine utilization repressor [Bosea caraganae]|uniref:Histidine utilization repressor n=1 Tax=Bosea caraganae TaxID=2763117 RepID=A0A370L982_9HYPH|nr:histidine utilization repressor [Bosea caraganae]RDJ26827.1 histidine utilization repressor [Bosea caraganae]RDJ30713.1 histidine utilization repressor [Bosea caraganae]
MAAARTASKSLHERILTELRHQILSGAWPPGHRIPYELDLSAQYGCSRMTMNKVLTELVTAGLIERRRHAGSFVRQPKSQSAILEVKDVESEVSELGVPHGYELLARHKRRSTAADRKALGLTEAAPVLEVICRHFAASRPFCLEQRLINLVAVPEAAEQSFSVMAPGSWLVTRVPWTEAEHRVRAAGADPEAATALEITEGAACLVVERQTWNAANPVTFARLTYPSGAHELVAHFKPARMKGEAVTRPTDAALPAAAG